MKRLWLTLLLPIIFVGQQVDLTKQVKGQLPAANVGNLPASKITSGTFLDALIAQTNVTQHQAALALGAGQVTSGTFDAARIPDLAAAKITSGTFGDARVAQSNVTQHQAALTLGASQITSGTLGVARGGTGVDTLTGVPVGSGTSAFSAVTAASQTQTFRRKPNAGTGVTYEFASPTTLSSTDYTFTLTNGTEVSVCDLSTTGAKTCTLTYSPLGVAGANTNHYIYVSGGTGTAEAVLITGGTCTSGQLSSCTLGFTTANTHTGAWTLTSATAGTQEAAWVCPTKCAIYVPAGTYSFYGLSSNTMLTLPAAKDITLAGAGPYTSRIEVKAAQGDAIYYKPTNGVANISGLGFTNGVTRTGGAYLHVSATFGVVSDIYMGQPYDGLDADACNDMTMARVQIASAIRYGLRIRTNASTTSAGTYSDFQISAAAGGTGVQIESASGKAVVGLRLKNFIVQSGAYNFFLDPNGGTLNEVAVSNYIVDSATTTSIKLGGSAGTANGVQFLGGRGGTTVAAGVFSVNSLYSNWSIIGFSGGAGGNAPGIDLLGPDNGVISGVQMAGGNSGGATDIPLYVRTDGANVVKGLHVSNSILGWAENFSACRSTDGVVVSADAHEGIHMNGVRACGSSANDFSFAATGAGNQFHNILVPTGTTKPTCAAGIRGSTWYTEAAPGVADTYEACGKSSANVYSWASLATW